MFDHSRRRFVQGVAGSSLMLAGGYRLAWAGPPGAAAASRQLAVTRDQRSLLRGTDFHLEIGARQVNFTGAVRQATVVNGQLRAPLLYWREGDTVSIHVTNRLTAPTSI